MADPIKTPAPAPATSESDAAELKQFRAQKARNEAIEAEIKRRQVIAQGMIPIEMLRDISARQVNQDAAQDAK